MDWKFRTFSRVLHATFVKLYDMLLVVLQSWVCSQASKSCGSKPQKAHSLNDSIFGWFLNEIMVFGGELTDLPQHFLIEVQQKLLAIGGN